MRLTDGVRIKAEAVLFDMDGTLVDSTAAVERVWRRWAARHALDPDAILKVSHGRRTAETVATFVPSGIDPAAEVAWLLELELTEQDGIVPVPGAKELLEVLPKERVAVVTSAPRLLALMRIALAGLPEPCVMISAEDVTQGKPDPEGYLEAARRLGVTAAECLVVEDAPAGLEAGLAAGAQVLALATTLLPAELDAWDWVSDLTAISLVPDVPLPPLLFVVSL